MRGLEKLSYARLAEVLSQDGTLDLDVLNAILQESQATHIGFPELLFRNGVLSEWKLARIISREFNLPIIQLNTIDLDAETWGLLSPEIIQEHRVVPIDKFGSVLAVAMPLLSPFSSLDEIQRKSQMEVFPYVAPISQVQMMVEERVPTAPNLAAAETAGPEELTAEEETDWQKLFDEADQSLQVDAVPDKHPGDETPAEEEPTSSE